MPLAIAVLVIVLDAALTVADPDPSRFSVEPVLVKLSPLGPSAVLSCATTEAMPSEKLTPTLSGLAPGAVLQRQRQRVGDVDDRDLVLGIGRSVGVGQVDGVARQ